MRRSCANILEAIGNTPLVEICRLNPNKKVKIYAKMESFNPGGSIKDRTALCMIRGAEARGELTRDRIILEATSGNTGIGLALVASAKGYRLCLTMSEAVSEERKKILRAMGADLVFTPANLGTDGAIEVAYRMLREHPGRYYGPDQFNNEDNILAHYEGTAEEIWQQTGGAVNLVVVALGTSGTAMGVSKRLKEYRSDICVVGVEPYLKHKIQGLKNMKESYRPGIFDKNRLDEKVNILDEDAFEMARRLAAEEGLLVGMSSGAAMHVAAQKASEMESGVIVVVFPDSGERYLSTDLFADQRECSLHLYNTLSRSKELFKPLHKEEILMHSCGPTVHEIPHLGSYRRFVVSDLIRRYLAFKGYQVRHLTNIIDLADRSIKGAERAQSDLSTYAERCIAAFLADLDKLNIVRDPDYPKASEHVADMLRLVERLADKGFAYEKLRSVYFDISKLESYGQLSNIDLGKMQHGHTIDLDDYEKDSPGDFTLLKRSTLSELKQGIYFKTRWGNVRPSWHLECAAISMRYLGETFDIHAGGTDIVFPHCENLLAIGKAATGKMIARYWINTDLVMVAGKKMSRSLDNVLTVEDLESKGFHGREIRLFLLSGHYRKPLNFSLAALESAKNTVRKLDHFVRRLLRSRPGEGYGDTEQLVYDLRQGFSGALDDDLNISGALAVLFAFVRKVGHPLAQGRLSTRDRDRILDAMKDMDNVLGILRFDAETADDEVLRLIAQREAHRRDGQWAEADALRRRLEDLGIEISDTPGGAVWRPR